MQGQALGLSDTKLQNNKMTKVMTRKSGNRLKGHDYSQPNYYYITTCTENRREWFGKIYNNEMILNRCGEICQEKLLGLPKRHNTIEIDTYKIMPNHVHAIIIINKNDGLLSNGQALGLSLHNQHISLSKIMRDFKSFSCREINKIMCRDKAKPCPIRFKWQRSFYDHIIRNDKSLNNIRKYIVNNPATWAEDEENINCITNQSSEFLPAPAS